MADVNLDPLEQHVPAERTANPPEEIRGKGDGNKSGDEENLYEVRISRNAVFAPAIAQSEFLRRMVESPMEGNRDKTTGEWCLRIPDVRTQEQWLEVFRHLSGLKRTGEVHGSMADCLDSRQLLRVGLFLQAPQLQIAAWRLLMQENVGRLENYVSIAEFLLGLDQSELAPVVQVWEEVARHSLSLKLVKTSESVSLLDPSDKTALGERLLLLMLLRDSLLLQWQTSIASAGGPEVILPDRINLYARLWKELRKETVSARTEYFWWLYYLRVQCHSDLEFGELKTSDVCSSRKLFRRMSRSLRQDVFERIQELLKLGDVFMAGGFLVTCAFDDLKPLRCQQSGDVDLWVLGGTLSSELRLERVDKIVRSLTKLSRNVRVAKTGAVTTVLIPDAPPIQIICSEKCTIRECLATFDSDYVRCYWDGGRDVMLTPACAASWLKREATFQTAPVRDGVINPRYVKALAKGFKVRWGCEAPPFEGPDGAMEMPEPQAAREQYVSRERAKFASLFGEPPQPHRLDNLGDMLKTQDYEEMEHRSFGRVISTEFLCRGKVEVNPPDEVSNPWLENKINRRISHYRIIIPKILLDWNQEVAVIRGPEGKVVIIGTPPKSHFTLIRLLWGKIKETTGGRNGSRPATSPKDILQTAEYQAFSEKLSRFTVHYNENAWFHDGERRVFPDFSKGAYTIRPVFKYSGVLEINNAWSVVMTLIGGRVRTEVDEDVKREKPVEKDRKFDNFADPDEPDDGPDEPDDDIDEDEERPPPAKPRPPRTQANRLKC